MGGAVYGIVTVHLAVGLLGNIQMLGDAGKVLLRVIEANAAGHAAVLAESVVEFETDYTILSFAMLVGTAPVGQNIEGIAAIVVVSIDNREGFVDYILCHEHCVGGAPRLLPVRIDRNASGYLVQFLRDKHEFQGTAVDTLYSGVFPGYEGLHVFQEVFAHYIDHLAESGVDCVVNGIVDDCFFVGAEAVHLLEAAVTAAHSSCKN